jgi:4-amino-4-deoxy-L-arabinose transferase-like glycosyltransferase
LVSILLACGSYIYLWGLGSYPLRSWDEAIYGDVAKEMYRTGEWITPYTVIRIGTGAGQYEPFLEKPPLLYWFQLSAMHVFGPTEFAVRLPSAVFTILTGGLIYIIGSDLFSRRAGVLGGLVFLTTPYLVGGFNGGRMGGADTGLVFFGTAFVYLVWLASVRTAPQYLIPMGVAAAGAVLMKGFAAGVFLVVAFPIVVLSYRMFLTREFALGVALATVLTLPWPVLMFLRHGREFVKQIFLHQVLERATDTATDPDALLPFMKYAYFDGLMIWFPPWLFFLFPALAYGLWAGWPVGRDELTRVHLLLAWWIASVVGFFVLTGNKMWYVMPIYVPAALTIGWLGHRALDGDRYAVVGIGLGAGVTLLVRPSSPIGSLVPFGGVILVASVTALSPLPRLLRERVSVQLTAAREITAVALIAICLVGLLVGVPPQLNQFESAYGQQDLGQTAAAEIPHEATIYVTDDSGRALHTFAFYSEQLLVEASGRPMATGEVNATYALLRAKSLPHVARDYTVLETAANPDIGDDPNDYRLALIKFHESDDSK